MNLTYEQVWATADELEAKGIKPTMKSVREALGKGSYTTVCKAMAERPERQFTTGADVKESLPPALTQHIERLGQQVWAAATAFANERLKSDREQFDRMRSDLEAQRTEAAEVASEATEELEAAQGRIDLLKAEAKTLRTEIDALRNKLASASERLAASSARGEETDRRIDDLNRELQRANEANAGLIQALGGQRAVSHKGAKAPKGTAAMPNSSLSGS